MTSIVKEAVQIQIYVAQLDISDVSSKKDRHTDMFVRKRKRIKLLQQFDPSMHLLVQVAFHPTPILCSP